MSEEKNAKYTADINTIKELVEMMSSHDLVEIEIVDGDNKIHLKRPQPEKAAQPQFFSQFPMQMPMMPAMPTQAATAPSAPTAQGAPAPAATDDKLKDITSPIVGTFYTSPSPDSDPYVKVGDRIGPETAVCIIEAMKVMNEIKAEMSGTIEKMLVSNGEAVEFGQPLFKIRVD